MAAQQHNIFCQQGAMTHNASSDSDNEITTTRAKIFAHGKPIHEVLGGGKGNNLCCFSAFCFMNSCWALDSPINNNNNKKQKGREKVHAT